MDFLPCGTAFEFVVMGLRRGQNLQRAHERRLLAILTKEYLRNHHGR